MIAVVAARRQVDRTLSEAGKQRRAMGSRRGAQAVQARFAEAITRKRFAALVGIHVTTVKRWESAGIVKPRMQEIIGIPTLVFRDTDVEFGRRVVARLREHPGELTLARAAELARRPPPSTTGRKGRKR